jgi:pyruvate kinase
MDISTKIICTIGPAVSSKEKIKELIKAGMNVARVNFSHGDYKQHKEIFEKLKEAREERKVPLAIMLDTKGPEIRIEKVFNDSLEVKRGKRFRIVEEFSNREDEMQIDPFHVTKCLKKGMQVLFNDGYIISKVVEDKKDIVIEIVNDGILKNRNGVNIPDCSLTLPAMTEKDVEDLKFGCENDVDMIAASFIRSSKHVLEIKKFLFEQGRENIFLVAKIENKEGLKNFDDIVEVADGIMVARGDLGVEVLISQVPKFQKMMIRKSNFKHKPVTIATQMLESMIMYPRPTRAEVSDVANAIYDSASSVMLSGETSIGKYPIKTVSQMKNVIKETEGDFDNEGFFKSQKEYENNDISTSVTIAAVKTAYSANAKAFFVYTSSGFTARLLSRWRPNQPILALTNSMKTYHQLSLIWGVIPIFTKSCKNSREAFDIMSEFATKKKILFFGDLVVVTAGVPFGKKGSTNLMILDSIGHVLVRGNCGYAGRVEGEVFVVGSLEKLDEKDAKGKILVVSMFDESYVSLAKSAKAIILQNVYSDRASEEKAGKVAKEFKIPLIVRAENAMTLLSSGEKIVLDAKEGFVYFS